MAPLVLITEPSFASRGWDWNGRCYVKRKNGIRVASRPFRGAPRFTEAELAAEVWHSITNYFVLEPGFEAVTEAVRNKTIERFATLPHYDEEI